MFILNNAYLILHRTHTMRTIFLACKTHHWVSQLATPHIYNKCIVQINICCRLSKKTKKKWSSTSPRYNLRVCHCFNPCTSRLDIKSRNHPLQTVLCSRLEHAFAFVSKKSSKGQMCVLDLALLTEISNNT